VTLQRVQILLRREQRHKLKELAKARGTSISELTRQTIDAGLEQLKRDERQNHMQAALEAARELRASMPILNVDITVDIHQMREDRDEQLISRH
jgi:AraC-like DNA-binding protein